MTRKYQVTFVTNKFLRTFTEEVEADEHSENLQKVLRESINARLKAIMSDGCRVREILLIIDLDLDKS